MRRWFACSLLSVGLVLFGGTASAEPTYGPFTVRYLRPYNDGGGRVYFAVTPVNAGDSVCGQTELSLFVNTPDGKAAYAALLAALLSGKQVLIEAPNSGCAGWGTTVQSVYIFQ